MMFQICLRVIFFVMISACTVIPSEWQVVSTNHAMISQIPPRAPKAMTGSEFLKKTEKFSESTREEAIVQEILAGNIPGFLRNLQSITVMLADGRRAEFFVMPDYLAIGSDHDFVRIPMTPIAAQKIASQFGFILPTKKMVNLVYEQATIKLSPEPMNPSREMHSNEYYRQHQNRIESQKPTLLTGVLVAGHKKDIVNTNRLVSRPGQVAIYGWHKLDGKPIQPLSLVHDNRYADYSHGVRLVARTMKIEGKLVPIQNLLKDSKLAYALNDEGALIKLSLRTY